MFFLSGNVRTRHCAVSFNCGKSTADLNKRIVLEALYDNLVDQYITLPTEEQGRHEAELFNQMSGIMDGSKINIRQIYILGDVRASQHDKDRKKNLYLQVHSSEFNLLP